MIELDMKVLERIIADQPSRVEHYLDGVAETIVNEMKDSMLSSPASGRAYDRGKGRVHIASIPGQPPRVDMGTLINSLKWRRVGSLMRRISDGVEYGIFLEMGRDRVQPRPFVRPVFDAWRVKFADDIRTHLFSGLG